LHAQNNKKVLLQEIKTLFIASKKVVLFTDKLKKQKKNVLKRLDNHWDLLLKFYRDNPQFFNDEIEVFNDALCTPYNNDSSRVYCEILEDIYQKDKTKLYPVKILLKYLAGTSYSVQLLKHVLSNVSSITPVNKFLILKRFKEHSIFLSKFKYNISEIEKNISTGAWSIHYFQYDYKSAGMIRSFKYTNNGFTPFFFFNIKTKKKLKVFIKEYNVLNGTFSILLKNKNAIGIVENKSIKSLKEYSYKQIKSIQDLKQLICYKNINNELIFKKSLEEGQHILNKIKYCDNIAMQKVYYNQYYYSLNNHEALILLKEYFKYLSPGMKIGGEEQKTLIHKFKYIAKNGSKIFEYDNEFYKNDLFLPSTSSNKFVIIDKKKRIRYIYIRLFSEDLIFILNYDKSGVMNLITTSVQKLEGLNYE
jgi:hypothetical protein